MTSQLPYRSFGRSLTARILLVLTLGAFATAALLYQSLCEADRGFAFAYAASALLPLAFSTYIAIHSSFQNQLLVKLNSQMEDMQSELETSNNKLRQQAERDPLTGLKNRRCFFHVATNSATGPGTRTVLALDVDRFKLVNDTFGHEAGDRALCLIAQTIAEIAGTSNMVARIGGEEFAVLLNHVEATEAYSIAERFRVGVERLHFEPIPGSPYPLSISVGICNTGDSKDIEKLLHGADMALLDAKKQGRNRSVFFEPSGTRAYGSMIRH